MDMLMVGHKRAEDVCSDLARTVVTTSHIVCLHLWQHKNPKTGPTFSHSTPPSPTQPQTLRPATANTECKLCTNYNNILMLRLYTHTYSNCVQSPTELQNSSPLLSTTETHMASHPHPHPHPPPLPHSTDHLQYESEANCLQKPVATNPQ